MATDLTTLPRLLAGAGIDATGERMQWMVLTWDLALIDRDEEIDRFVRIFLTTDDLAMSEDERGPKYFSRTSPWLGSGDDRPILTIEPLAYAQAVTERALGEGYRMVCRPLAVDCSALQGQVFSGPRIEKPEDVLIELTRQSLSGVEALRVINLARWEAMATHAAPGWDAMFPRTQITRLWSGLAPSWGSL